MLWFVPSLLWLSLLFMTFVYLFYGIFRRRMRNIDLKRAVCLVCTFGLFLFAYLYWQQSTTVESIIAKYKHIFRGYRTSHPPQWTWHCMDKRCERRPIMPNFPIQSLSTCSMLCGSSQLWPQPTGPVTLGSRPITFNHLQLYFDTDVSEPAYSLLQHSFAAFNSNVVTLVQRSDYVKEKTDVKRFVISVTIAEPKQVTLLLKTDESYHLTVKIQKEELVASISAKTFFGARHGLETLSQLIWWDEYTNKGMLKVLKGADVQDKPAFAYRGLMLDTARNFMSVDAIRRVLIGMAANKLNVFHWHVSDSQSFPLLLPRVPQLAKHGAYDSSMTYGPEEVLELVKFARTLGIRVLIEVDIPAHAGYGWTWGPEEGLGDLAVCVNEKPWSLYCGEPPCGQLNPDNPNVYSVLEKLYKDLLELSGERELFHLGGDEVNLECWSQFLQKSKILNNYTDLHDLWGDFTLKAVKRLESANRGKKIPHVILWSSNLSKRPYVFKYLDKDNIVVQSWGSSQWSDTPDLISDGYNVIISHVDAWYLDCGFGRWRETGDAACDPYRPWQTVYNHRPWQQFHLNRKQIMGGEVCLWSEQVDEGSLDARLWPRAAGFAERVWSDPQVPVSLTIEEDVYTRLDTQRSRMLARGLGVEALWPEWCKQNPDMLNHFWKIHDPECGEY